MQMVLTPNDLFSWNNKYNKYTIILSHLYTLTIDSLFIFRNARHLLCACSHSEAVKGSSSLSSTCLLILTMDHVFSLPLSGANWCSLSLLWGFGPPFPKMALPFTGSAHTPFPGYKTVNFPRPFNPPSPSLFHVQPPPLQILSSHILSASRTLPPALCIMICLSMLFPSLAGSFLYWYPLEILYWFPFNWDYLMTVLFLYLYLQQKIAVLSPLLHNLLD